MLIVGGTARTSRCALVYGDRDELGGMFAIHAHRRNARAVPKVAQRRSERPKKHRCGRGCRTAPGRTGWQARHRRITLAALDDTAVTGNRRGGVEVRTDCDSVGQTMARRRCGRAAVGQSPSAIGLCRSHQRVATCHVGAIACRHVAGWVQPVP